MFRIGFSFCVRPSTVSPKKIFQLILTNITSSLQCPRADVEREVRCNDKQRFSLWMDKGVKRIRANQGHKMKEACSVVHIRSRCCLKSAACISFENPSVRDLSTICPRFWLVWPCIDAQVNQVVDSELLTPITSAQELPVCNLVI